MLDTRRRWFLVAVFMASYAYFYSGPGWNQDSRFDLVRAILEKRTLEITAYHDNTGDKSRIGIVWNEPLPASVQVRVSPDGDGWTAVSADALGELTPPIVARYVRVEVRAAGADRRGGIRELEVIRAR